MTLAVQTVRQVFNGNGSTDTFAIPFSFSDNDQVEVILVDTNDEEDPQVITTDYTIVSTNVVMNTPPASGEKLLLRFDPDLEQQLADFNDQVPFQPTIAESAMDDIVKQIQALNERINRCLIMQKSSAHINVEMERTLVAGSALVVNDDADGLVNGPSVDEISNAQTYATNAAASASAAATSATAAAASATAASGSATAAAASAAAAAAASSTPIQEKLVGNFTGGNTDYTTSQTPVAATLLVFLGAVPQEQGVDYTLSGTTIRFTGVDVSASDVIAYYRY